MNPLFLPVRVIERALDDLAAIGDAARRLPEIEATLVSRVDHLSAQIDGLREDIAPIQQLAEVRKGIEPLDEDMRAVRAAIDDVEPLVERISGQIAGMEARLDALREDLAPLGELAEKLPGIGR